MKYSSRGHRDRNRHKKRIKKRSGQAQLVYVEDINRNVPTTRRGALGDNNKKNVLSNRLCVLILSAVAKMERKHGTDLSPGIMLSSWRHPMIGLRFVVVVVVCVYVCVRVCV